MTPRIERFLADHRPPEDAPDFRVLTVDRAGRGGAEGPVVLAEIACRGHGIDFEDDMSPLPTDHDVRRIVAKVFGGGGVEERE
jgi:hypothetical protein